MTALYKVKTHFHTRKNIYYLSPQRYQVLAHVTALLVRTLSQGLEWSKARMVGHLRCLTRRTEDKRCLLQENADGAQHPLPTRLGNNWAHESIINVTESPKPVSKHGALTDVANDFYSYFKGNFNLNN